MNNKACTRQKFAWIGLRQVKTEENLDGFNKGSQKTIGIPGQIITKFDSIIYDPWYYKNFLLVSCPDLGEKIA